MDTANILTSLEIAVSVLAERSDADRDWVLGLLRLILDEVVLKSKQGLH